MCEASTLNSYLRSDISGAREFMVDNAVLLQPPKPVIKAVAKAQGDEGKTEPKSLVNESGMIKWTGSARTAKRDDDEISG